MPPAPALRRPPALPGLLPAALCSALTLALLAGRWAWTGRPAFLWLAWNLFLAWLPYALALLAQALSARGHLKGWALAPLAAAWLLLLPNAPYLLTDFVHLRPLPGVPLWFDAALLALFAGTGWLLGVLSLEVWMQLAQARRGRAAAWGGLVATCVLCGYGVYLGRVERWNSWDVLRAPRALARDVLAHLRAPGQHPGMLTMTALFALLLFVSYASLARLRAGPDRR